MMVDKIVGRNNFKMAQHIKRHKIVVSLGERVVVGVGRGKIEEQWKP